MVSSLHDRIHVGFSEAFGWNKAVDMRRWRFYFLCIPSDQEHIHGAPAYVHTGLSFGIGYTREKYKRAG